MTAVQEPKPKPEDEAWLWSAAGKVQQLYKYHQLNFDGFLAE